MFRRAKYTCLKLRKTVFLIILYYVVYSLFAFAIIPDPPVTFVSDEYRMGDKYVLMFLLAPAWPVFSDADAADVFKTRYCGRCFITNNKGFLPITEYDAVLVYGKRNLISEAEAVMEPNKRYLIETNSKCIKDKLRCLREPKITSFATQETHTLCGLCEHLIQQKYDPKKEQG